MAGIWTRTGTDWKPAAPQPFSDERALQEMVAKHPRLLPLAGSPQLIVLGREVRLGNGKVDVLAVETSGRPAIIEVKLARNSEARRAIVSQVLAYAAFLRGFAVDEIERGPLNGPLQKIGYTTLNEAVQGQDQESAVDLDTFRSSFQEYLTSGQFRVVLVLDEVSTELDRIISYLDSVTVTGLTIDLVTVSVYKVGGTQIALPQRISPDSSEAGAATEKPPTSRLRRQILDGPDAFIESVTAVSGSDRESFDKMVSWASEVGQLPDVRLVSTTSPSSRIFKLIPRLTVDNLGLVAIGNEGARPCIQFWRSRFETHAPNSINKIERLIAPKKIGQGNTVQDITPEILAELKRAYAEAVGEQT